MLILLSIAVIVRIYYVDRLMVEVSINEDIYNAAKVSIRSTGLISNYANGLQMQTLYISNLYLAFLLFGNFTVAGVYLNILYQVLTVLLVFVVVKSVTNRYVGFAGGLILAILPIYINTLSEVTMQNMEIFIVSLIGTIVFLMFRLVYRRHVLKKNILNEKDAVDTDSKEGDKNSPDANIGSFSDTSMKEIRYDDLEDNKVQYIENPLPVPKRREHKEMNYAFEPTGSDDDYDVKDMTGKDFYDIE